MRLIYWNSSGSFLMYFIEHVQNKKFHSFLFTVRKKKINKNNAKR